MLKEKKGKRKQSDIGVSATQEEEAGNDISKLLTTLKNQWQMWWYWHYGVVE